MCSARSLARRRDDDEARAPSGLADSAAERSCPGLHHQRRLDRAHLPFALGSYLLSLYLFLIAQADPLSPWTILIAMPSLFMGTMPSANFGAWDNHAPGIQAGATFAIRVNAVVFVSHVFRIWLASCVVEPRAKKQE
jgi:hypothetical protein